MIFGVLRILNLSHGSIYALGAYMGTFLALTILDVGLSPYLTYVMLLLGAHTCFAWWRSHRSRR